jgi:hypothetical protein
MIINNENSGLIFTNEVEEGSRRPQLSGFLNVNGEQYKIAMWENDGGSYGVKLELNDESESAPPKKQAASSGGSRKTYTNPARR